MEDYITPEQMMREEKNAAARGISVEMLMESAGKGIADKINELYGPLNGKSIVVVAGKGNNGGDGLVAARYLAQEGGDVKVILLARPEMIKTQEARANWDRLSTKKVPIQDVSSLPKYADEVHNADIILAAIFGTGIRGNIRDPEAGAIRMVNTSRAHIVAADIPSGLDPLTGEVKEPTVKAEVTITLHRAKTGLKNNELYTGRVITVPIGL